MTVTEYSAAIGALSAAVVGVVGALTKAWLDNKKQDHAANMDQLHLALAQIQEQSVEIRLMQANIASLTTRIEILLVANTKLEAANEALQTTNKMFRHDITELQKQIRVLGHEPVMNDEVPCYVCDPTCPLAISKASAAAKAV